jgi:hypothetical protein
MPIQVPQIPNLTVQQPPQPDPLGQYAKFAQLKNMLSENTVRQQLAPLQVQQQQQENQQRQMQIDSQKALMDTVASGALNKYATGQPDGTGFDAAGAYKDLMGRGNILSEHASQLINSYQAIDKNNSEIRKNLGAANADYLKTRAESHEQVAEDIADILKLPPEQQAAAWALKQPGYSNMPGLDPNDKAILSKSDIAHLPAIAGLLDLNGRIEGYHAKQAEQAGTAAKGEQAVRAAAPVTPEQLTNAVGTVATYNAVPPNMRVSLANEMKAAPDWETLQKVQSRADAANESFQRSADARGQALALKDVGVQNLVAGKLVTEDQKLGSALDQTSGIRGLLDMSKGGNQAATNAALTRFAEHEIVEGGVKRMNQLEYENLATKLGSYGRKFQSWVDGGFKGQMPAATNSEIHTILDAEDQASNVAHDRNVGYIMDRYAKPGTQPSGAKPATPRAAAQRPPLSSFEKSNAQ